MESKKNPKADLENKRGIFFQVGLVIAIGIALLAFEWETYEVSSIDREPSYGEHVEEEIIPITYRQAAPTPLPPPPAPSPVMKLVDDHTKEVEKVKEQPLEPTPKIEIIEMPEEVIVEEKIFRSVQKMPSFPGCETESTEDERQKCTSLKMMQFLRDNIKYPPISKDAGVDGKVYLTFVVDSKGEIRNVEILHGVQNGAPLDKEAVRVVNNLPNFNPGKQRGKAVSVIYTLPVNFSLR